MRISRGARELKNMALLASQAAADAPPRRDNDV